MELFPRHLRKRVAVRVSAPAAEQANLGGVRTARGPANHEADQSGRAALRDECTADFRVVHRDRRAASFLFVSACVEAPQTLCILDAAVAETLALYSILLMMILRRSILWSCHGHRPPRCRTFRGRDCAEEHAPALLVEKRN